MKILKTQVVLFAIFLFVLFFSMSSFAKGWVNDGYDWYYQDEAGVELTGVIQSSNGKKYYLDDDGRMVRDYLLEDYNDNIYYFNDDGEMVTNTWVAVDPYQVSDPLPNGPTVYLYYFGPGGKAYKANEDIVKKTIDGKKYMFDSQGRMLSGWIDDTGEMWNYVDYDTDPFDGFYYYAGDETDGVLREGWLAFEDGSMDDKYYDRNIIWLYFSSVSYRKVYSEDSDGYLSRKINGKTYAFDDKGVMLMGWEAEPATKWYADEEGDPNEVGALAKKRWTFAVPSKEINDEDYENGTYRWFYSESSGNIAKNGMKRINGHYYAFDKKGVMRDGLVVLRDDLSYVARIDLEETDGKEFIINRRYVSKEDTLTKLFDDSNQVLYYFNTDETTDYFGSRKTGVVEIPFAEKDYEFNSNSLGAIRGKKNKKLYQNGFTLKADPVIGFGVVLDGYTTERNGGGTMRDAVYIDGTAEMAVDGNEYYISQDMNKYTIEWPHFVVVDHKGTKITKYNIVKKDKEDNYWIIGNAGTFQKIVSVPVRVRGGRWFYRSDKYNAKNFRTKSEWIEFGEQDVNGYTVRFERGEGNYEIKLTDQHCVNFALVD